MRSGDMNFGVSIADARRYSTVTRARITIGRRRTAGSALVAMVTAAAGTPLY